MGGSGSGGGRAVSADDLKPISERVKRVFQEADQTRRNLFLARAYEDENEVNLFRAQARNEATELDFNDWSLREPFDSEHAEYIKRGIRERIRQASVTLVYLSTHSASSRWVDWEIRESIRLGKKVIGVYPGDTKPPLPPAFTEFGLKAIGWRHEDLMREIGSD